MNPKLIPSLQIGGFFLAFVALVVLWVRDPVVATVFTVTFGVHVAGDVLLLKKEGLL
jgi:hypothetical protein